MTSIDWARVDTAQVTAVQDQYGVVRHRSGSMYLSGSLACYISYVAEAYGITAWRDNSYEWHQLAIRGESGTWYPVDGATLPPLKTFDKSHEIIVNSVHEPEKRSSAARTVESALDDLFCDLGRAVERGELTVEEVADGLRFESKDLMDMWNGYWNALK